MLPLAAYQAARHRARFHLQVRLDFVEAGVRTPGPAEVKATVVRVFRGGVFIQEGASIRFRISVAVPGDEIPAGGIIWKPYEDVLGGRYLEAFLDGDPPDLAIALSQSELVAEPTLRPVMRGYFPIPAIRRSLLHRFMGWIFRKQ